MARKEVTLTGMEQNDQFLSRTFDRFLLPTILSVLGGTVNVMVDGVIIGNFLGQDGLAAVNLCTPVYLFLCTLGSLIANGAGIRSSVAIGRNAEDRGRNSYTMAFLLLVSVGLAVTALGLAFLDPLTAALGASGSLYPMVRAYIGVTLGGSVVKMLLYLPFQYLRIDGRPKLATGLLLTMTVLNAGLDLLFLAVLDGGMAGAAAASVLASSAALAGGLFSLHQKGSGFHLARRAFSRAGLAEIFKLGSPAALNNFLSAVRLVCLNLIILRLGGSGLLAVFTMVNSMSEFSLALVSGVPQTASPLLGVYSGERDAPSIRRLMGRQLRTGELLIAVFAVLTAVLVRPVCLLFGLGGGQAAALAAPALRLFALGLPAAMACSIFTSLYNTSGRLALANAITVCRVFLFAVGSAFLLARSGSTTLVWLFYPMSELLTLALIPLMARLVRRKNADLSPLYLLDESLERNGQCLNFSVENDPAQAASAGEKIEGFCEENGLTPKQTMAMSLSIEEMLTVIFQNCFSPEEKETVDVRVFCVSGVVGLRLRNGGKVFNPLRWYQEHGEDGLEDTLGIKLITNMAELVTWQRTFGVNSLQILLK